MTSKTLTTAGTLLMGEIGVFVALSFGLSQLGIAGQNSVFVGLLAFNLVIAWFMAKAAQALGKSALLYGVLSIVPPGAIYSFILLWTSEQRANSI